MKSLIFMLDLFLSDIVFDLANPLGVAFDLHTLSDEKISKLKTNSSFTMCIPYQNEL